jgi:hypothetical protein
MGAESVGYAWGRDRRRQATIAQPVVNSAIVCFDFIPRVVSSIAGKRLSATLMDWAVASTRKEAKTCHVHFAPLQRISFAANITKIQTKEIMDWIA